MEEKLKVVLELQDKLTNEMKKVSSSIKEIENELKGLGKSEPLTPLKDSIFNFANFFKLQIATKVLGVIKDIGLYALNASSDMEELENVTSQVFGSMQKDVEMFSKSMSSVVGRSVYSIQKYASDIGAIFKGLDIDEKATKDMSEQLALLAIDIGSFKNISDDEAFNALRGAIVGETESLKRLGIVLNDTTMAEYARNKGIKESWQNLNQAAKAELRYQALMEKTTFMQGDAARTIGSYANQLKLAKANIDNLAVSIGNKLKTSATGIVNEFNSIAKGLNEWLNKKDALDFANDFSIEYDNVKKLQYEYKNLSESTQQTTDDKKRMKAIIQELQNAYPDVFANLDSEITSYEELAKAIDKVTKSIKAKTDASLESYKEEQINQKAQKMYEVLDKIGKHIRSSIEFHKKWTGDDLTKIFDIEEATNAKFAGKHEYDEYIKKWRAENEGKYSSRDMTIHVRKLNEIMRSATFLKVTRLDKLQEELEDIPKEMEFMASSYNKVVEYKTELLDKMNKIEEKSKRELKENTREQAKETAKQTGLLVTQITNAKTNTIDTIIGKNIELTASELVEIIKTGGKIDAFINGVETTFKSLGNGKFEKTTTISNSVTKTVDEFGMPVLAVQDSKNIKTEIISFEDMRKEFLTTYNTKLDGTTKPTGGGSNGSNNSKEKPRTILDELKEYGASIDTSKQKGIPEQSEAVLKQINDIEEKVENKINSLELNGLDALQYKLDATNELISKTDKYSLSSGNKDLIKKVDALKQKKEKLEKEINREKNNPIEKILSSLEEEVSLLEYSFKNDQLAKYLENRAKLNKSLLENIDKSKELGIFTNLEALENKKQILADEIKKMSESSKYIENDDDKNRAISYIESLKKNLEEIEKQLEPENLIKKKEEVLKEFSEKLKNIFKDNEKDINSNKFDILFKDFFFDPIKQTKEELEKSRTKDEASKAVNNLKETILNIPEELAELININFDNLDESIENLKNQIDSEKLKVEEKQVIENILKLFSDTKEKYKKFQEILEKERLEEQIKESKEKQKKIVDEVKQYANEFLNSFVKFIKALPFVPEELQSLIDDLSKFFEQTMEFATNVAKAVISGGADVESIVKAITSGIGLITTLVSEMVEYFSDSKVIKKANEDYENKRKEIISNITALNNLTTTIKELNTNIVKQLSENTSEKNIKFQEKVLKSYIEVYSKNFNAKFVATGYKDRQTHESTKTKTALGFSFWSPITWGYGLYKLFYRKKENISAEKNLLDILGLSGTNSKELQEIYDKKIKNLKNEDLLAVFKEYDETKTSEYYDKHDLDGQTLDFYITNSNLEELKKQFLERIEEVKKLEEKQKSLKRDSIFESFDGVSILDKEEQKKQIIENFKKLYADREDLPELIKEIEKKADEIVENNARLVNVFDEVRNNIISNVSQGNNMIDSLANGLQSYFNKLRNNLSKVKYDGVFRDLEEEFENEFLKITEKLTDYRINGSSDIKKFAEDNIDFKTLFGKVKLVENINNDIKDVVYMLREQAKLQGLSEEYINMMFPLNDIKEKIFDVKSALSNAMTAAINTNSFIQFSMSLGDSIYSSVKNALIQAFVESDTYKNLFDKYFNTEEYKQELNKAISFKESFDIIQNQLNKAEEMLKGNGLSFRETNAVNGEYLNGITTKSNIAPTNIYSGSQAPTTFEFNLYNNGVMDNDTTRQFAKEVIKLMRENEKLEVRLNDSF